MKICSLIGRYLSSIFLLTISLLILIKINVLMKNPYMFIDLEKYNPYYDLTLGLLWFLLFSILIMNLMNKELTIIWLLKGIVTLIVMLPYEANYKLDAFVYFTALIDINNEYIQGVVQNKNTYLIALFNSYLGYLIGDSYHALKLFYSLISFIGLILFYRILEFVLSLEDIQIKQWYIYFYFLFPTVLFWSSTLGKDSLNIFVLGFVLYAIVQLMQQFTIRYFFILLGMLSLLFFLRFWFIGIFLLTILQYFIYKYICKKNLLVMFLFFICIVVIITTVNIPYMQGIVDKLNKHTFEFAFGGSATQTYVYYSIRDYFLYLIPNIFTTLFRPMLFDVTNMFTFISACENIVLFLLFVRYILLNFKNIMDNKYIAMLLFYCVAWLLFYVIISPANLGSAVRFKLQVLPVILIIIGYSIHITHFSKKKRNDFNSNK